MSAAFLRVIFVINTNIFNVYSFILLTISNNFIIFEIQ